MIDNWFEIVELGRLLTVFLFGFGSGVILAVIALG